MSGQRWVVVADSVFWPPMVGGHREHAGFVDAALDAGLVGALVVPVRPGEDPGSHYGAGPSTTPVVAVPRDLRPRHLIAPRRPFVVGSRPVPGWLVGRVRDVTPDATGVVVYSYKSHRLGRAIGEGLGLPVLLRQHNIEAHYHRELARGTPGPRGWLLRWEAARIARDDRRLGRSGGLRAIADISVDDAAARRVDAGVGVHHVGPFALSGAARDGRIERAPRAGEVLFLGALDVPTNHEGLRWFVDAVWPRVRERCGHAHLVVVGRHPPPRLHRLLEAVDAVEIHADVPDTRPHLTSAAVAVNPTVSGSGVNIKLVEYLVAGVPTVTTRPAATGLGLGPDDVVIADGAAAFADAVLDALADPDAAERAAAHRAADARVRFGADAGLRRIQELLA